MARITGAAVRAGMTEEELQQAREKRQRSTIPRSFRDAAPARHYTVITGRSAETSPPHLFITP